MVSRNDIDVFSLLEQFEEESVQLEESVSVVSEMIDIVSEKNDILFVWI